MSEFCDGPDFTLTIEYESGRDCWYWVGLTAPGLAHPRMRKLLPSIAQAGAQLLEGKELFTADAVAAKTELLRTRLAAMVAELAELADALDEGAGECETASELAGKVASDIRGILVVARLEKQDVLNGCIDAIKRREPLVTVEEQYGQLVAENAALRAELETLQREFARLSERDPNGCLGCHLTAGIGDAAVIAGLRAELVALQTEARRLVALVRRLPNTVDDYDLKRVWRGVERLDALLTPEVPRG